MKNRAIPKTRDRMLPWQPLLQRADYVALAVVGGLLLAGAWHLAPYLTAIFELAELP